MSIPTWSYDSAMYDPLTREESVYIKTDEIKGKGLFSKKAFEVGDQVLAETAMCCTQFVDEFVRRVPCCGNCLVSLESPRAIASRVTKNKSFASELPFHETFRRRSVVYCKNADHGCSMVFCSYRCREAAMANFHTVCCRGTMTKEQVEAFDSFLANPWQQGGIDYSDTHFFALKFVATALSQSRLHNQSLEKGFKDIAQLIKAPLGKFNFSFLLADPEEQIPKDQQERAAYEWNRFLKYKDQPESDPRIITATSDGLTKQSMLQEGYKLLSVILGMSREEEFFFPLQQWSELLGAVLLNGQERSPNSPYVEFTDCMAKNSQSDAAVKEWTRRAVASGYNLSKCASSSKGQGIYRIGCLFNHSCNPNLQIQYPAENDETLVALCVREIKEGDELCISYINENLPFTERQQQLFEHYLFVCQCEKCEKEREMVDSSDERSEE